MVSTLCTIYTGEVLKVSLGRVDGDIDIGQHIFVGSKANWEVIPEDVTQLN
ncbi:MAG: hypothetical protein KUG78_21270 [Kangiellaceae bacterium]|nr:hypothetical protein [Kangiellaceae bacterium]